MNTSITAAYILDSNNDFSEARTATTSRTTSCSRPTIALAPGLVLAGDVAYFDLDQNRRYRRTGDKGCAAVGRFAVAF